MTGPEIMAVVGFFVMLSGTLWAIWWRIENKVKEGNDAAIAVANSTHASATATASAAQALAALARDEIAAHRLHVAETYITKAGMRETTEQIMEAISGVKQAVDHMTARVDRIVENQPQRRAPAGRS